VRAEIAVITISSKEDAGRQFAAAAQM